MRWHLFVIGRPKLGFAKAGVEEYAWRLVRIAPVTIDYLKAGSKDAESAALLERSEGMFRIVLDERGEEPTSRALAGKISEWELQSKRDAAVLIGGADGHCDELRQAAAWTWSLSRMTLQHELALVVCLEQIYRAYSIKAGLPYHRD
jgi:23S rRNA (pseudouridine1915-N3)-methyltransferase